MKNTKRFLVATLAFVMLAASMLVLVSCGHKHDYKSTVTEPTCTERGYTTYTCSCGKSYVDDYVDAKHDLVQYAAKNPNCLENGHEAYEACKNCDYTTYKEISSTGDHYYERSVVKLPTAEKSGKALYHCDGCGHSYEEEFTVRDIELPDLMGAVASALGDRYYSFDLGDGFNLVCIKETTVEKGEDTAFEGRKSFLAVKLPKAYLEIKDAHLKAEIEVQIGEATVSFNQNQNPENLSFVKFDAESVYYVKVDGNRVITSFVCGEEKEEYETSVYELIFSLISDYLPGDTKYESVLEIYAVYQHIERFLPAFEKLLEELESMEKTDSDVDYTAVMELLTAICGDIVETEKDGEDTVYTLKLENLSKYVEYLEDATVRDMIDGCFGNGFAAAFENFARMLPELTVKQIANVAITVSETYGFDVDEFYALVNGMVYLSSGVEFDIASEIDERNEYTVAMLVAEIMGAPEGSLSETAEALGTRISEMLALILDSTVDGLFETFGQQSEGADAPAFTDTLKGVIAMLGEKATLEAVVDKNGGVKSISVNVDGFVSGSYTATENGYVFVGEVYGSENTANLTAKIGLDGTVDLLLSVEGGESDTVFSVKYDSENIDVLLKSDEYTMLSLYVDIADGKVVSVDFDVYDKIMRKANNESGESEASEPSVDYWHVFALDYSDNGDGRYSLEIVMPEEDRKIIGEYDGENLDVVILDGETSLFNLYVDITDGKITAVDLDVRKIKSEKRLKEEYKHLEDLIGSYDGLIPSDAYEIADVVYHILAIDYADNGDGTYSLDVSLPEESIDLLFALDTESKTLDVIVKENGNTLAEAVFALTEDALSMDMTIYTEDVTSDVDIVIKKNSFTYTVVLDGQYKILDMEAILEDGAITSFKFDYNDYYTSLDYVYDEELGEWVEVPLVIFEDAIEIKYIGGGNVHKIQFKYYGYSGDVVFRIGDDQKSVSAEAVVVYEEYNWEDEANPIIHTIFDGSFGIGYSCENGVASVTLSVDVEDLVTEEYDWEEFEDSDEWYWIFYFEKCIYDFDGELTFSFKIG